MIHFKSNTFHDIPNFSNFPLLHGVDLDVRPVMHIDIFYVKNYHQEFSRNDSSYPTHGE